MNSDLHFLVEADDREALSSGMQGLIIAAARAINTACGRRGKMFEFRYHTTYIKSPKQARHALACVLNNWRRHREDFGCDRAEQALVDPYSSGITFSGWRETSSFVIPELYVPLSVASPQSWLLTIGWQKHGAIGLRERPGPLC